MQDYLGMMVLKSGGSENISCIEMADMNNLAGFFFSKDTNGKYLDCDDRLATMLGFNAGNDMRGMTDFDLSWNDCAQVYKLNDERIIAYRQPKTLIESGTLHNGLRSTVLSYKFPLRTRNRKVTGIMCVSYVINPDENPLFKNNTIADINPRCAEVLSKRQKDCLRCLVKGMTIKEIAYTLKLSPRTVEHYLEAIKIKLNCYSRSELIQKCIADK